MVGWLYDISCQFEKYLRNLLQRHDLIAELKSAVAELLRMPHGIGECHVLGHKIECQLFKSARVQLGLGLTDGEQPERLHAVLVRYANQLKYSSPEKFKFTLDYGVYRTNKQTTLFFSSIAEQGMCVICIIRPFIHQSQVRN